LFAQIANLCQTLEVFAYVHERSTAFDVLAQRSGTWFSPELVRAAKELENDEDMWAGLETRASALSLVRKLEPGRSVVADEPRLDSICEAFGEIIDAKSPFTQKHSKNVAIAAVAMASNLGLSQDEVTICRRAALLHDLGKLGVPNTILDKPAKLDPQEWEVIRMHPLYTQEILQRIPHFQDLAAVASSHHEKLDGSGYHLGVGADQLSLPARIIAVADIYDALVSERPYRKALETEEVLQIISRDVPHRLDASCFEALKTFV
jgi:putative nucleotidyltransferase with HDIG domain